MRTKLLLPLLAAMFVFVGNALLAAESNSATTQPVENLSLEQALEMAMLIARRMSKST